MKCERYFREYINSSLFQLMFIVIFVLFFIDACKPNSVENNQQIRTFYSTFDISNYPEIETYNHTFYDLNNQESEFLSILKENGVNTIRLRLWVDPVSGHSDLEEVEVFTQTLRTYGFKIWLTLHYSDTWADPGSQHKPEAWSAILFDDLKDSVYNYTARVVVSIEPEIIQIGNEVNNGILHPDGHYWENKNQFLELVEEGIKATRDHSADSKIMIHYAGYENSKSFFSDMVGLDYDYIGLSYYPLWHGKDLTLLQEALTNLETTFNKPILIAETAYPFTLDWDDQTTNIVGQEEQLILPEFPATSQGQQDFILAIKEMVQGLELGAGICYWGAELIAWKGLQATEGSAWENQAVFDFDNKALPVLEVFKD